VGSRTDQRRYAQHVGADQSQSKEPIGAITRQGPQSLGRLLCGYFVAPSYPTEIELQNLVAVLECTSKSLLPAKYRQMDHSELVRRANELVALLR
jgi:hypothetical protein